MLSTANAANADPKVRAAEKQAQLARVAAKGKPGYSALYASQPEQIRIAAEQKAQRAAIRAAKDALKDLAASDAAAALDIFKGAEEGAE